LFIASTLQHPPIGGMGFGELLAISWIPLRDLLNDREIDDLYEGRMVDVLEFWFPKVKSSGYSVSPPQNR